MSKQTELTHGEKHIMRLMARDKKADGWTTISSTLWPWIEKMPRELVELHPDGGKAKLTEAGEAVIRWT